MNRKVLVIAVALMAVAALTTPVMAIGPFNALEVGNNKNLEALGSTLVLHRGGEEGHGTIFWTVGGTGEHWVRWEFQDAGSQAKGLMNNAIIAAYTGTTLQGMAVYFMVVLSADELDNKWIYLSGDGATYPGQWGLPMQPKHGMLYWFTWGITYLAVYAEVYAEVYAATPGTPEQKDAAAKAAATAAGAAAGAAAAAEMVADHPQGLFWKHNDIPMP